MEKEEHLIFWHFQLNVYESNGDPMTSKKIESLLRKIVEKSKELGRGNKVGALTAEHRDKVRVPPVKR